MSVDHGGRLSRRSSCPVLLTLTTIALLYQQVPPPFGAVVVKSWLHYALAVLGGLLLAQFVTHVAKIIWSQIKKLAGGFSVTGAFRYDPNRGNDRDSEHLLEEERTDAQTTPAAPSARPAE